MSVLACIARLREGNRISDHQAEAFEKAYNDLRRTYERSMGKAMAEARASRDLVDQVEYAAIQSRRQKLLQLDTQTQILERLDKAVRDKQSIRRTIMAYFTPMEGIRGIRNIDLRKAAVAMRARSMMNDFLGRVHRNLTGGINNPALLDNIVREMMGEKTGDVNAAELAQGFRSASDYLRGSFNEAGGAIAELKNWFPQDHNSLLIRRAGFEAWRDDIMRGMDRDRMIDNQTKAPLTDGRMEAVLREVYNHITTEGLDRMVAGQMNGGKLANRRMDHRFLHFKDADSYLAYQKKYGTNAFDAINGHIDSMARDIGAMQVLGPNPSYTVKWMQDVVRQDAAMRGSDRDMIQAKRASAAIQNMWHVFTGENAKPIDPRMSTGFAIARNLNSASKLGGAAITGLADVGFTHAMANFNGLNSTRLTANFIKGLNPLDDADRALARRTGILATEYAQRAIDLHGNYGALDKMNEVSRRLSNGMMTLTGLHALTSAGQAAIAKEFMMSMADHAAKPFESLSQPVQQVLSRYGLDGAMWDAVRSTPTYTHSDPVFGNVSLIRPDELAARKDLPKSVANEAATRFLEMIEGEKRFGMPDAGASLRTRAAMDLAAGRRGTFIGELIHSTTQFKQFPVSVIERSMQRAIYGDGTILNRATFAANAIIATTLMGGIIMQMKSIAGGKDPEPMISPAFWARAAMQGGAMGIYGDFLKEQVVLPNSGQKTARDGKTLGDLLIGPTAQSVLDPIMRLAIHDTTLAASNEIEDGGPTTNWGREVAQFFKENTPGSSVWYARAAFNRLLWDKMQTMMDPNAQGSFERQAARAQEEEHRRYWWAPGQTLPDHAPDLGNALTSPQP